MIVFYTFDPPTNKANDMSENAAVNLKMLKLSIFSIKRELGDYVQVRVYTTKPDIMKDLLKGYNVSIIPLEKKYYYGGDHNSRFKNIGHARIFLIKDILKETKDKVMYMDQDTGIMLNTGQKFIDTIDSYKEPLAWASEINHFLHSWCFESYAGDISKKWPSFQSAIVRNNGIIFFPYNFYSLSIAHMLPKYYKELLKRFGKYSYGFDMTTISQIWEVMNLKCFHDIDESRLGLAHYYGDKYSWDDNYFKQVLSELYDKIN